MYSNKTTGAAVPRLFCSYIYYIMGFQPQGSSASGVFGYLCVFHSHAPLVSRARNP